MKGMALLASLKALFAFQQAKEHVSIGPLFEQSRGYLYIKHRSQPKRRLMRRQAQGR